MWVVPSKSTPGLLFWWVLGGYFQARFGSAKPCSVTRRALMTHQILKEVSVGAVEPYISPGPSSRMDEYLIPQRRAPLKGTITHPAVGLGGEGGNYSGGWGKAGSVCECVEGGRSSGKWEQKCFICSVCVLFGLFQEAAEAGPGPGPSGGAGPGWTGPLQGPEGRGFASPSCSATASVLLKRRSK